MARNMYGATSADFTLTSGGRVIPGAVLTLWTARTGGTQITDLLDVDSVACTTVTSAADGSVVYYGPDSDADTHWADSGQGSRIAIRPVNLTGVGANGVNTAAIQDSAVTSDKIADGSIMGTDINSAANIATTQIAGNPIPRTLIDAKGDLIAGTANDTVARLPVGTNGHVLTADSAQAAGVKWAAVAAGGGPNWIDVKAYSAVGDDTANDTTALQNALTAAAGKTLFIGPGTYRITSALTVAANTTIVGTGTIHQVTSGAMGLDVNGSGVTIDGITLLGRHASTPTYTGNEHAIDVTAANLAGAYTDTVIHNVKVKGWGAYGIFTKWVDGFTIEGCMIANCGYTGIGVQSGANGIIHGNRVKDIGPGSSGNMYGIELTYGSTEGAANPATRDVTVADNIVTGVNWEGIDAHSGLRLVITSNQVLGCKTGIAFTQGDVGAATDCIISNNLIDTLSDTGDGTRYSVQVFGLLSGSTISVPASVTITGNVFRRCGAMQLEGTRGTIISNNLFRESYQYAIFVLAGNDRLKISDNTFVDVWSVTESGYCIIVSGSSNNTNGIVVNNQLARGDKTATWVNYCGIYVNASATGTAWKVGWNDFAGASWNDYAGTLTAAALPTP